MRTNRFLTSCALLVGIAVTDGARAWGPEGHTVTARVAVQGLNSQAQADLQWIISVGVPALNAQVQAQYGMKCQIDPSDPFGPTPDLRTDHDRHTNLANWADCYRYQNATTAGWHFNDIPLGDQPTGPLNALAQTWCTAAKGYCVSVALANNLRQLNRPGLAPADAAMALAFVVHFMGDMHQPLHEEDNNDVGGNRVQIITTGSGIHSEPKLHSLWDGPLVEQALGTTDLNAATTTLAQAVAQVPDPAVASVDDVINASDGWAEDAHKLAGPAYSMLNISPGAGAETNVQISRDYVEQESQVVGTQLALAAARLRAALNAALSWSPPP